MTESPTPPPTQSPNKVNSQWSWMSGLPSWFAAIAGAVYSTGFLIQLTFLQSMGIKDAPPDILSAPLHLHRITLSESTSRRRYHTYRRFRFMGGAQGRIQAQHTSLICSYRLFERSYNVHKSRFF